MTGHSIILHQATDRDSRDIWLWRNDRDTIQSSNTPKYIPWEQHKPWFEKVSQSSECELLIGKLTSNNKKVGMVRFDALKNKKQLLCSINLNPTYRGQGLSAVLLSEAIKQKRLEPEWPVYAEIKQSNIASIKCFEKNNFKYIANKNDINQYLYTL